jgi:hypothetical protein
MKYFRESKVDRWPAHFTTVLSHVNKVFGQEAYLTHSLGTQPSSVLKSPDKMRILRHE